MFTHITFLNFHQKGSLHENENTLQTRLLLSEFTFNCGIDSGEVDGRVVLYKSFSCCLVLRRQRLTVSTPRGRYNTTHCITTIHVNYLLDCYILQWMWLYLNCDLVNVFLCLIDTIYCNSSSLDNSLHGNF